MSASGTASGELAVEDRRFTFAELHRRTAGVDGPRRAAIFRELPEEMQAEAYSNLREHFDDVSARDFEETCGDNR
jgi:hypothetical protein